MSIREILIDTIGHGEYEEYHFDLQRHTGKKQSLKKGNQVLNANDRMHYIVKSQISQYLRELAYGDVWANDLDNEYSPQNPKYTEENPCVIVITVNSPTKHKIDPPNIYPTVKALIDGMTDAGLWSDDNEEILQSMSFHSGERTENKKYRVTITIIPWRTENE